MVNLVKGRPDERERAQNTQERHLLDSIVITAEKILLLTPPKNK